MHACTQDRQLLVNGLVNMQLSLCVQEESEMS